MSQNLQHLHPRAKWLFLSWALIIPLVLIVATVWLALFPASSEADAEEFMNGVLVIGVAIAVIAFLVAYIWASLTYKYYLYELRSEAFRKEHGIIWKKYVSIPYERIQNVDIHRGLIARLLGLSDIVIQTAGMSSLKANYGGGGEGRLPGIEKHEAERIRDELIRRAKGVRHTEGI